MLIFVMLCCHFIVYEACIDPNFVSRFLSGQLMDLLTCLRPVVSVFVFSGV